MRVDGTSGVRIRAIISSLKAWGNYQDKIREYKDKLVEAEMEHDIKKTKYWLDNIKMTEAEIGEFLDIEV